MSTLHCALENGVDLYVNERQKILHYEYRARSPEERSSRRRRRKKKNVKSRYFTSRGAYVKLRYMADIIHSFDWKSAIEHDYCW